jgi:VanZ family protein
LKFLRNGFTFLIALLGLGCSLLALSFDYPHAWMPVALSCLAVAFFACAEWLPTIAFRFLGATALSLNVISLFLVSSVQRMNIFQRERPMTLDVMMVAGFVLTLLAFGSILLVAKSRRKPAVLIFLAILMVSLVAYASSSQGGPSSMLDFLTRQLGMSASVAEHLTIAIRKSIHFGFYGILASMILMAAKAGRVDAPRALRLALVCALAVACFDELRQTTAEFRSGSVWDIVLDMLGATTFSLLSSATKGVTSK